MFRGLIATHVRCAYPRDARVLDRELEEILNKAWSTAAVVGLWISFDEQMVKCTARVAHFLIRFNKNKPIKHGKFGMASSRLHRSLNIVFSERFVALI